MFPRPKRKWRLNSVIVQYHKRSKDQQLFKGMDRRFPMRVPSKRFNYFAYNAKAD